MVATSHDRTIKVKLATGEVLKFGESAFPDIIVSKEEIEQRYGMMPSPKRTDASRASFRDTVEYFFEVAKRILQRDGFHLPLVFLFLPDGKVRTIGLDLEDQTDKYAAWPRVASEVKRYHAKAVISINEAWIAPLDETQPLRPASQSLERKEVLTIDGANIDGEEVSLMCTFEREDDQIILGETEDDYQFFRASFEPVKRVWRGEE